MYDLTPTLNLSHEEWLKLRKSGIGGSDAGAIMGVNPYRSIFDVYNDKTSDEISLADNEAMRQGRDLEEYVAKRFTEETGLKVRRSNMMYRNSQNPFMIADVDRLVVGEDAGLECKTANAYAADNWADGKVPLHYIMQCMHYMAVTGRKSWYIAVLIMGKEFKYTKITWDDEIIKSMIEVERSFWYKNVVSGILPAPDGSESCGKTIDRLFNETADNERIMPLEEFKHKLDKRAVLIEHIEELKREQAKIEQEIKLHMQDCTKAESADYKISWNSISSMRLDAERIKREMPDIYKEYAKPVVSRRFVVKAA